MSFISTDKYIKIPSVTTTQRNSLTAVNGMIVYDSTLNALYKYEDGAWTSFAGGGGISDAPNDANAYVRSALGWVVGYTKSAIDTLLGNKEGSITAGTTSQYWRGDKSWQTLNKSAVGLGNVDNTSDANKPVSTATQTALDTKIYPVVFHSFLFDPNDATNYFFGGISNLLPPSQTNTNQDFKVGYACTVVGCVIQAHGNTTQGSSEDITLSLRNNTTNTTTVIGVFKTNATSTTTVSTVITGLNIPVGANDNICLQMNGTWATNPQALRITGQLNVRL